MIKGDFPESPSESPRPGPGHMHAPSWPGPGHMHAPSWPLGQGQQPSSWPGPARGRAGQCAGTGSSKGERGQEREGGELPARVQMSKPKPPDQSEITPSRVRSPHHYNECRQNASIISLLSLSAQHHNAQQPTCPETSPPGSVSRPSSPIA